MENRKMKKLKVIYTLSTLIMLFCLYSCSEVSSPYNPDMYNEDSSAINIEDIKNDPFISDTNVTDINDTVVIKIVLKIVTGEIKEKSKEHDSRRFPSGNQRIRLVSSDTCHRPWPRYGKVLYI